MKRSAFNLGIGSILLILVGVMGLTSQATVLAGPGGPTSKTTGATKVYVVRYKTRGWVQIDYQYQRTTSELIGQGVNAKMAQAKALGFATKRKTDQTTYVFGANAYRTYAYAKADNWHERSFDTKAEQEAFQRRILRVVPSYTNDGPGLNTQLVTR